MIESDDLSESLSDMGVFDVEISRDGLKQDIARLREALEHFEAEESTKQAEMSRIYRDMER